MGARFKQGSVWSDGATPPAGKVLTVGYVAGDSMFISRETDLFVWCTVTGTAPTSVDFQLHTSTDGTNWESVAIPGRATIAGDAMLRFNDLKSDVYYRLSAKRTGGDATTKLLALGHVSPIDAAPLPVGTGGGVVLEGYSAATGATSVDLQYVAGTATNVNGGNRDAGTQTVTLADDDPATVSLGVMDDWDNAASDGASVSGEVAHDDADAGEPVKIGGKASTSTPVAVDNNDRVNAYFDEYGRLHVFDENGSSAAAGDVAHDAVDSGNPVKVGGRARTSQIAAVANDDRTDAIFNAYGEQVPAGHDWTLNATRATEINPNSEKYAADEFEAASIASGTTVYYYIDMAGYKFLTIIGENTPGTDGQTITAEATTQDDGTAAASCLYADITQYGLDWLSGAAAASNTTGKFAWATVDASCFKYVRIKCAVGAGVANDAAHDIYIKKQA